MGTLVSAVAWRDDLLACATYQLDESTNKRRGGVLLYQLHKNERAENSEGKQQYVH